MWQTAILRHRSKCAPDATLVARAVPVHADGAQLDRAPFHRSGWIYEEKVDGWRMLAYKDGQRVQLVSRNGVDHTRRFPDLALAVAKLSARSLVLDGEVAIYDQQLRSRSTGCASRTPPPSRRRRC